jgi:hypothetical protein
MSFLRFAGRLAWRGPATDEAKRHFLERTRRTLEEESADASIHGDRVEFTIPVLRLRGTLFSRIRRLERGWVELRVDEAGPAVHYEVGQQPLGYVLCGFAGLMMFTVLAVSGAWSGALLIGMALPAAIAISHQIYCRVVFRGVIQDLIRTDASR